MSTFLSRIRAALALAAVFVVFMAPLAVTAAKGDLKTLQSEMKIKAPLTITLGKADLVSVEGDVSDVLVADPSIVDVMAVQSNSLYVVGVNVGDTNIIALDAMGNIVKRIDIHVAYDLQAIQSLVNELYPEETVKVGAIHDQILLTGTVSNPDVASKITNIVGHYVSDLQDEDDPIDELISNLLEVRGEQQVMLQVKIMEASRTALKELGMETYMNDPNELSTTTLFGGNPGSSVTSRGDQFTFGTGGGIALSQDAAGIAGGLIESGLRGVGLIGLELNALEERNLVNILAEPNLTAVSGEQAGFLAGGEFPVPAGRDQVGNIIIEFREFGVSLNFRPVVLSGKRISLQMNTEVSSLDFENAVTLADLVVPGLDIRRADTTVEIPSGGSLMIAGILRSDALEGMTGLPGISKTPVLGDLVKSDSFQRSETELVVIVTPYLVEPYAEEDRAAPVPKQKNNPLAQAFAANIRRVYDVEDEAIFALDEQFGYLLD
ncbi:MAG TPA: type II and III secretion system protein family protein [Alphaproteobacteria bacterium]|nr:type II and III secretion system protein family protein [Alphaproteobacteria bacterium]USO05768.1 MAG: type II and III secretion system protein family protein [Rhodospirillales bacterium]HOO81442.1 type II and III secretion system protein family protein [Alphaproteobacteria bacterium]